MSKHAILLWMLLYLPDNYAEVVFSSYQDGKLSGDGDMVEVIEALLAFAED